MPATPPTILATSGGLVRGERTRYGLGPLVHHALELSGVAGRAPRLCYVGTAGGDDRWWNAQMAEAAAASGVGFSCLNLFPMPPTSDLSGFLGEHDALWVGGGSVANLLALWRLHGLDVAMREVWEAGVVLAGVSAGSLCWHVGGTTDSFGPQLEPVTDALGLLPYGNGVHYDSEERRRPLLHSLVADGTLPDSYATDDGVGLRYEGTRLVEVVSEVPGKAAYFVSATGGEVSEERLEPRLLGTPS
ncbi:MAG: peptidase [Acidimicrobiaceae bacterium]|nr:peptidase [Acidimicrobiaceae bacterium]